MKKKIFFIVYVLVALVMVYFLSSITINEILRFKYKNSKYSNEIAYALTFFGFPEQYVSFYNCGNILYMNGDYYGSMDQYKKALATKVPENRECCIRINYALSICKLVNVDESNEGSVKEAIKKYNEALDVLTPDKCANSEGTGHSKEAQELYDDIKKEIERLEQLQNVDKSKESEQDEQEDSQEKDEPDEANEKESKKLEEKIKDIKEDAQKEQKKSEDLWKSYYEKKYNSYKSKNW